jgi:molybdopterin-containing oxidoreductase family iron-sulfur binding subunit
MKTIPPPCPEPEGGQKYWRSLDQLAEAPEFRTWLEREFPDGASEFADPVSRRNFVKVMSASFALGGLGVLGAGCRRPEEKILPFGKAPENYIHGVAQFYATAMPTRGSAVPLLVRSNDGRPTKIEGNPEHPDSNGGTDTFAQASLLSLYDPDRARNYRRFTATISRAEAADQLGLVAGRLAAEGGRVAFLLDQSSSPSRVRLATALRFKYPQAKWVVHEAVDLNPGRQLTGSTPYYKLEQARVILSFDCDFLGAEADAHRHIRGYARGRKLEKATDAMNRLYVVEGLMTVTGMNADHRLRMPTGQVAVIAAAIAAKLAPSNPQVTELAARLPLSSLVKEADPKKTEDRLKLIDAWVTECAADLAANRGTSVVLAGHRQPLAVHVLANLVNGALGNNGKTTFFAEIPQVQSNLELPGLVAALKAKQISTLIIIGGNPAYNAPADLGLAGALSGATEIIRLGGYEDETMAAAAATTIFLPEAHYLESWGDARTSDGSVVPIQPLIAPLFDGMTDLEVLARLGSETVVKPYDIVRETFRTLAGPVGGEEGWKKFLHDGFLPGVAPRNGDAPVGAELVNREFASLQPAAVSKDSLEVVFHRDYRMDDGRWSNNGWLQEFPDPVTKITWDGLILVSRKTAEELGLRPPTTESSVTASDIVEVTIGERKVRGPIWVQPGLADNTLALALGYGRKKSANGGTGRVGHDVGLYDAYALRTTSGLHFAGAAKIRTTGERYQLALTQEHGSMEGRPIIREANKAQYEANPNFAKGFDIDAEWDFVENYTDPKDGPVGRPKGIYEHPYEAYEKRKSQNGVDLTALQIKSVVNQWGMVVDLNACVGCSACVLACQSENNIPIVGKDQVRRNREMHWLRIDRYFSGAQDKPVAEMVDDPQVVNQPMMCQHCENAPCESVCPVNATVHDAEGVNVMAYNRCVGTRYCSNNCPYKVRHFNFLDYNRRSLDQLKGPFYSSPMVGSTGGEWTLKRWFKNPDAAIRPQEEWDLIKLVSNPDVTVRMRGVMEKCTLCVQRIEQGKIAQKIKAGQSGDVRPRDGAIKTACQQACPAEAITFGNILDEQSKVSRLRNSDRNYEVLRFLETRPRVTYLARIRNPNPKMPDYRPTALNQKDYVDQQHVSPYEPHHGKMGEGGGRGAAATAEQKGTH